MRAARNQRIPSRVSIGGFAFSVVHGKTNDGAFGEMHFDERKIVIDKVRCNTFHAAMETLKHEMMHAALSVAGVSFMEKYDEEVIVRALENIFFPAWNEVTKQRKTR